MSWKRNSNSVLVPEIWGGIECTINRVGDTYYDQCRKNGHWVREGDLKRIRDLGIEVLRYPFLWERADWDFFDLRIKEMKELQIRPIAGLLHHGSGPKDTNLSDPSFPQKFSDYAKKFATRYPEVDLYTPVNEPLTTARFSGLYGVWYPHAKTDRDFLRILYFQTKASILAMKEIRKINPSAQLIQTEDLGRATGTPKLSYQVQFENERRWLSFDLLCGKVNPDHSLYSYLIKNGILENELKWLEENATPPDVLGINHYMLSNRFLDDELHHHHPRHHGGNGVHGYADVGAINTERAVPPEPHTIFIEAWQRYGIPVAVTEVHAAGGKRVSLRWFEYIWNEALKATSLGAHIRAITAWSMFGTYDWNSLCTADENFYEPGIFDVSSGKPKTTLVAEHIKELIQTLRKKQMKKKIGIAGCGFAGAVLARELAESGKYEVTLYDERDHVAGNCHTSRDPETNVMIHHYGPHIFNTSREDVWSYVNRWSEFKPFVNRVKAHTEKGVYSLPINLLTINQFFRKAMSPEEARAFVESLGDASIKEPQSFEDQAKKFLGADFYKNFFYGYTKKQWGVEPSKLPASILKRLPVRFNYDDNYYNQKYQGIPVEGYTQIVKKILDHPQIRMKLGQKLSPQTKEYEHVFWSGPMDGYFDYRFGRLNYRTLTFKRFHAHGDHQGNPVINYCEEKVPYTRIAEHKHFAPWEEHEKTVYFEEYSKHCEPGDTPYYPMRLDEDKKLLEKYVELAKTKNGVSFIGRLGTYRYLDMHVVIGESLDLAKKCIATPMTEWPSFSAEPLSS